jgi:hypothetical protein
MKKSAHGVNPYPLYFFIKTLFAFASRFLEKKPTENVPGTLLKNYSRAWYVLPGHPHIYTPPHGGSLCL